MDRHLLVASNRNPLRKLREGAFGGVLQKISFEMLLSLPPSLPTPFSITSKWTHTHTHTHGHVPCMTAIFCCIVAKSCLALLPPHGL